MSRPVADMDDDVIPDGDVDEPKYEWFQRPAPHFLFTFAAAALLFVVTFSLYRVRVHKLRTKFGTHFKGSLRACAKISAYMDNYEDCRFAILRLCTKSLLFLGFLQIDFHMGFWIMWSVLVLESSLDTIRVYLAYRNCESVQHVSATSVEEARDMRAATQLDPTNVYEDLTRPKSIAVMVFLVQGLLIGLVMDDTYRTTTRTCFDGTDGCPMLSSLGSYCLYLIGVFMASVFYVGPRNSYGQKEQNPTFWLKLFLMSKETSSVLSWNDPVTDEPKTLHLAKDDALITLRFLMSFVINGIGFLFLLHVLPIQVASQSAIIGVVFRAIGMIYLADLDDSVGSTMTLVPEEKYNKNGRGADEQGETATTDHKSGGAIGGGGERSLDMELLEQEKQRIIEEAMKDAQAKLEALIYSHGGNTNGVPTESLHQPRRRGGGRVESITGTLFRFYRRGGGRPNKEDIAIDDEETPLVP